jgi:hypothetical protein
VPMRYVRPLAGLDVDRTLRSNRDWVLQITWYLRLIPACNDSVAGHCYSQVDAEIGAAEG